MDMSESKTSIDSELVEFQKDAYKQHDGRRIADVFRKDKLDAAVLVECRSEQYSSIIDRKVKGMIRTTEQVTKELEDTVSKFGKVIDNITNKEVEVQDITKRVGSKVKDSTNKLGEGLAKLERTCNFGKLDKYAETLSNLADSLERIAELERTGKLEKLISAMK
jgi:uncharacterized protein Yka (UPF0111/DUF47 family)